jgi:hypothetical protein
MNKVKIKRTKTKQIIKNNLDKLDAKEIVLFPAGFRTKFFINIFKLKTKFIVKFIADDNINTIGNINDIPIKHSSHIKDDLVLITNYVYADKIEKKLKERNIKCINPFVNIEFNNLKLFFDGSALFEEEKFDIYRIYTKIKN